MGPLAADRGLPGKGESATMMTRMMPGLAAVICFVLGAGNATRVLSGAEPSEPLRWKHVGDLVDIHTHRYLSLTNTKRVIRVVLERLSDNRESTREELLKAVEYAGGHDENGIPNSRPLDSFRNRTGRAIYWVLEGDADAKLEQMTPLGVVYCSGDPTCGQVIIKHYPADILWHPGRQQYLLFLAMSCSDNFSVAIFPLNLNQKLDVKPFAFADREPIRIDGPQPDWPEPLPMISELRTKLPDGMCDIMNIRVIPELKRIRNELDERNLLISGWNTLSAGETCSSVTYRYRLRQYQWTRVTYDEQVEVPVERKSAGDKKLTEFLESFPKEGDPGGIRGTRDPLDPIPDPDSQPPTKRDDE